MADPIVQFVDSPSTSANVRYDFSMKAPTFETFPLGADAIDFGVPAFTGEPEGIGAIYSYRQIRFTQRIIGTRAVALARMSLLAKEMLRSTNWLRFQWDPSASPVWFKTYRTEPGALSLENAGASDAWDITVPLDADPFAYGARVTIPTAQVIQGPTDLTSPTRTAMRIVLPTIKGEAPTALRVKVSPIDAASFNAKYLIGCVSGKTTMVDPVIDIGTGDGFTSRSGVGTGTSDAAYFNGSYRLCSISSGSNFLDRLDGTLPNVTPGRYKAFLRCEADGIIGGTVPYIFTFMPFSTSGFTLPAATALNVSGDASNAYVFRGWVDLGDVTLPAQTPIPSNITDTLPAPSAGSSFNLWIGTSNNTAGTVRLDALKLVPIDGPTVTSAELLTASYPANPPSGNGTTNTISGTFDGDSEFAWNLTSGGLLTYGQATQRGAYPTADPAADQNTLFVMALNHGDLTTASANTISKLNSQAAVDISYHPRYLHIGDGT